MSARMPTPDPIATLIASQAASMLVAAVEQIREKVRLVEADAASFYQLSTGERIAVALVLDRHDLVLKYGSILDAVIRLGPEWLAAARYVQKHRSDE